MNLKSLFGRKTRAPEATVRTGTLVPVNKIDLDALEACVGGRAENEGVGCYMQSAQTRVH